MKTQKVLNLISAFVTGNNNTIDNGFKQLLEDIDDKSSYKSAFKYEYKKYQNKFGQMTELPQKLKPFVFESYQPVAINNLMLNEEITEAAKTIKLEWNYRKELLEHGLNNANRILLVGPPGNGKTSFAVALSSYLGITPYIVATNRIIKATLGASPNNIMDLISNVPQSSLLFIDEFDALATARSDDGMSTSRERNNVVNSLIMSLDRLQNDILFVAATNRKDALDRAVTRRFDMILSFSAPTDNEKKVYLDTYMKKQSANICIDPEKLKESTSYSDIERLVMRAHKQLILSQIKDKCI